MPSPPLPGGYDNQNIESYQSPNTNGFSGHNDGYRSPPPGAYRQPRSPAPPYVDQTSNHFFSPDSFQGTHEKPIGGPPMVYGVQNGMDMPVVGTPPDYKRICGLRRKYFWIILIIIVLIFLAGLGAGLGIALGKKKNGSGRSQADQLSTGVGTSTTTTITSASSSSTGGLVKRRVRRQSRRRQTILHQTILHQTILRRSLLPPPPEPSTPDPTTPEPTTPDPTTPNPTTPNTTTPNTTTPNTTTPRTTTPSTTTPNITTPPAPTAFTLEDGYNTLTVTVASTTGNLCPYLSVQITTTVYISIAGDASDPYTAVWKLDNYPATLTATGALQETGSFEAWGFEVPINSDVNGCSTQGGDVFLLEDSGRAGYSS
ncbi:hypothetical protein TWF694_003611 [Orbilia ellipsospora]|uniref:Uncharacterized protein n=1 Tax=Orbilia ellipsospora TaxID=2528407 RepID=A0AAV9WYQ8_9PEZI